MSPVKSSKPSRIERARQTRHRMIEGARDLFATQGYAATTMEQIATRAGVAVQTVYYTFRTKGQLLCEVVEVTAAGEDAPVPVAQRPWMRETLSTSSAQRVLALAIEHGTGIYERAAPLWPAVNAAAAADPHVEQYWQDVAAKRRAGQGLLITRLSELGALRQGLDTGRATDLLAVLFGHEVFRGLIEAGWTIPNYKAWLFATLVRQLLNAEGLDASAVQDLTYGELLPEW